MTLTNAVSGAGALHQIGTGVTSINTANTYTGGTTFAAGTLAIGNGGALGTGALTFASGELLATATATVANGINLSTSGSTTTIVAAPDTDPDLERPPEARRKQRSIWGARAGWEDRLEKRAGGHSDWGMRLMCLAAR